MGDELMGQETGEDLATSLRRVVGRLQRTLRRSGSGGLTPSMVSVLSSLDSSGPARLCDLARQEGVAPPTLSRVVERLSSEGLVVRAEDLADRRSVVLSLSPAGTALLASVRAERARQLRAALEGLSPQDRAALESALPALESLVEALS